MEYVLFYTGLASTPNTIGLKCKTTGEIIHEYNVAMSRGSENRKKYDRIKNLLSQKYAKIL